MSEALNKDLGTVNYDNLVIRAGDVGHIELAAGQGELPRGAVIDMEGKLMSEGGNPCYILCDETKIDDLEKTVACVYKNGKFIRSSLYVAQDYELTDVDVEKLRYFGFAIEDAF